MQETIAHYIVYAIQVGIFWLMVALLNPNIDSGLVWILAIFYAGVMTNFAEVKKAVRK